MTSGLNLIGATRVFDYLAESFAAGKRYIGAEGGTSSSKTYSILQLLLVIAFRCPGITISVMSESFPHLKKGVIKDFLEIIIASGLFNKDTYNRTDHTFKIQCEKGGTSVIEFFSADLGKVTGPRRHIAFFNECNNIEKDVHDAAEVRTSIACFYDFNPTHEFWFHSDVLSHPSSDVAFARFTYKDNQYTPAAVVRSIESRKDRDPDWWRVYGLGLLGTRKGLVFEKFTTCNYADVPKDAKRKGYGMDFGFTNDPTTLMDVRVHGDNMFIHEMLYQTAMHNSDIVNFLKGRSDMQGLEMAITKRDLIVADSAEPKSISDISRAGFNIIAARKGPDSVKNGIDLMKRYNIVITSGSINTIKEFRNYRYKTGPDGQPINEPVDMWNHSIDPTRYALDSMLNVEMPKIRRASIV